MSLCSRWNVYSLPVTAFPMWKARLRVPSIVTVIVSGTFYLFDRMCKQVCIALNPFFNGMKNDDVDGTCKRSLHSK